MVSKGITLGAASARLSAAPAEVIAARSEGKNGSVAGKAGDAPDEAATAGRRIALADDEPDLVFVLVTMISKWNYDLEMIADDGTQLVTAIAERKIHPHIVLMDYRMKGTDGLTAAKKILLLDPSIRIIIASADDSARAEVAKAGLGFLQKPFSSAQLKRALDSP